MTDDQLSSSRAVVRSGMFNLAGFLASAAYMFLLVPVAVGYLGMEVYGLWMTVLAITGYIGLADFGLSTSFVTYIARFVSVKAYDDAVRVVHLGLLFYGLVCAVMLGLSIASYPVVFEYLKIPEPQVPLARDALLLVVLAFGVTSASGVFGNTLAAIQRMDLVNGVGVVSLAVKFVAIVLVLHEGGGLQAVLLVDIFTTAAGIPAMVLLTRRHMPFLDFRWKGYDHRLMKTLMKFGAQMQVSRLAEVVQFNFDKLLLARFSGLSAVSMYDFGSKPAGRVRLFPVTAIASLVPAVSALDAQANEVRIRAALVRSTRYLAILAAPLFAFFIVFADPVMQVWLGPGRSQAALTLQILSCGFFFSVVVSALAMIAQGRGEPQYQMRATLAQACLNVVLSTVLIVFFGYFGAVIGTTVATASGALFFFSLYGRRVVPHPVRFLGSLVARPVLWAAVAAIAGGAVHRGMLLLIPMGERFLLLIPIAIGGCTCAAVYALALKVTKTLDHDDLGFFRGALPVRLRFILGGR